ncbi:MAG: hypothetical protein ABI199_07895 [Bacteroidia bacterium]
MSSCSYFKKQEKNTSKILAKVYTTSLYETDVAGIVPKGMAAADSIVLIRKYVDNWVREELLIHQAETNLPENKKNVDKQLQDYRNSLITYAYEKELIRQKLDTSVTDAEIEKYYNDNTASFLLKDNILKVIYVKVKHNAPQLDRLRKWYKSDNIKDRQSLANYCYQFAENYYLDDNTWLLFDDILKEIPIETYNKELFLQNNRFVEVADSGNYYFLNIKGFKIKDSTSPLAFEKNNIRSIILNKRKLELTNKMKNDIYQNALADKKIEIYTK